MKNLDLVILAGGKGSRIKKFLNKGSPAIIGTVGRNFETLITVPPEKYTFAFAFECKYECM